MKRAALIPTFIAAVLECCLIQVTAAQTTQPLPIKGPTSACRFSRDGSEIFAARNDAIVVLSARDGSQLRVIRPGLAKVTSLDQSPDARFLLIGGGVPGVSGAALLVEQSSGRTLATADVFKDIVTSVAFAPDGRTIAVASADRTAHILSPKDDPITLTAVAQLEGHAAAVLCVVFSRDGKVLVTGSADRSIKVWDLPDGKLRRTLSNHTGAVFSLAARIDSADDLPFTCASAGDDRTVRVWQPDIGRMVRIVRGHQGPVLAVAYAPDGTLFSAGAEGIIRMIHADSDAVLQAWKASDDWIYALAASPDGASLAAADWTGAIKLWRRDKDRATLQWRYPS